MGRPAGLPGRDGSGVVLQKPLQHLRGLTLERGALVLGFGLSILATVGSQVYYAPVADHIEATVQSLDATWARLKIIRASNALFNLLQSFDGLVYLIHPDFDADYDRANAITEVGTRAIHSRHDAVLNYFAQAAAAGEIDYHETKSRYESLIAAEDADWNLKTYSATNALPADIATRIVADRIELDKSVIQQERELVHAGVERDQRASVLNLLNVAGSSILFVLALISARDRQTPAHANDEMSKAIALMSLALAEAKRRIAEAKAGAPTPLRN